LLKYFHSDTAAVIRSKTYIVLKVARHSQNIDFWRNVFPQKYSHIFLIDCIYLKLILGQMLL